MDKKQQYTPDVVFPMWQAAQQATDLALELSSPTATKVTTGLPSVDQYLNPFIGSTLVSVIGRPGHAKTFFSDYMLIQTMNKIMSEGKADSEAVVLIATEVPVEVAALKWMAKYSNVSVRTVLRGECTPEDLERIDDATYKVMGFPIFFIGYSEQRSKSGKKARPNLTPDTLNEGLDYIINTYKTATDDFLKIRLMVTDYLQQLHKPLTVSPVDFYSSCVDWAKNAAVWAGSAHILNVQAGRQVDERQVQIPLIGDPQWTSNVEQTSTVVLSVHRPEQAKIRKMPPIWDQTPELMVTPDLFYLALLKQKEAISNKVWALSMDFENYTLREFNDHHH